MSPMTVDHKNPSEIVQIAKHGRGWAKMITEQELLELYKLSAEMASLLMELNLSILREI